MSRETVTAKAARYLSEGRLVVTAEHGDHVTAVCRGDGDSYQLGHHPRHGWHCNCAARGDCAHLVALRLVTSRANRNVPAPAGREGNDR